MYFIYAISSIHSNYIYVGMTKDVEKRVEQHNSGWQRSTKTFRPFELIVVEEVDGKRNEVRAKEKYRKFGIGREKLRILKDKS